jgi:Flp pilus assembly pilin Flp
MKEKSAAGNGQSFIEYTILIIIVSAALVAMTAYLMRSTNARLKQSQQELDYYKQER